MINVDVYFFDVNFDGCSFDGKVKCKEHIYNFSINNVSHKITGNGLDYNEDEVYYIGELIGVIYEPILNKVMSNISININYSYSNDTEFIYAENFECFIGFSSYSFDSLNQRIKTYILNEINDGNYDGSLTEEFKNIKQLMEEYHISGNEALNFLYIGHTEYTDFNFKKVSSEGPF